MNLRLALPTEVLLDEDDVRKVSAEAEDGAFTMKPRHVDFVATLVPGILSYHTSGGEQLVAVGEGVLVKCGDRVMVSVHEAVQGTSLETLEQEIEDHLSARDERERRTVTALARLEANLVRRFLDLRRRRGR